MKTIFVDAYNTFILEDGTINNEMHKMLEEFSNTKIIMTNANDEEIIKFGLDKVPYEVFTLKHNPDKVDPKFYETALKHFNLDAKDIIYFEHNAEAVKSAQSVGINVFHYDKDTKNIDGVKNFISENI